MRPDPNLSPPFLLQPTKVIRREPSREPGGSTWTGFGFMQVYEGSDLTFDVPAIFSDLDYDLIVRYEHLPNYPDDWTTATAQLIPLDGPPGNEGERKVNASDSIDIHSLSAF